MNPTKALAHPITLGVFPLPNRVMEVVAVYEDPETAETPALDSVSRARVEPVGPRYGKTVTMPFDATGH